MTPQRIQDTWDVRRGVLHVRGPHKAHLFSLLRYTRYTSKFSCFLCIVVVAMSVCQHILLGRVLKCIILGSYY